MTPEPVSKEVRQFNLILALKAYPYGLEKTEILSSVVGFRESYSGGPIPEDVDRLFERDKREIRDLGIDIEVLDSQSEGADKNPKYRIREVLSEKTPPLELNSRELALLKLAASVWRTGTLNLETRLALRKLRSSGIPSDESIIGVAPRIGEGIAALDIMQQAIHNAHFVSFVYQKSGEQTSRHRTVAPLATLFDSGHWFIYAYDEGVDAPRTFVLSRIVSQPVALPRKRFQAPAADHLGFLKQELNELRTKHRAEILIKPGTDALRLVSKYGADTEGTVFVQYFDEALLADELTEFVHDITVVSPESLREALDERLAMIAMNHEGAY